MIKDVFKEGRKEEKGEEKREEKARLIKLFVDDSTTVVNACYDSQSPFSVSRHINRHIDAWSTFSSDP